MIIQSSPLFTNPSRESTLSELKGILLPKILKLNTSLGYEIYILNKISEDFVKKDMISLLIVSSLSS